MMFHQLKTDFASNLKSPDRSLFILKCCANIIFFVIIALAIGLSFRMNIIGRSLWLDEAMLAHSLSTRSLSDLTSSIFELDQSAPVLYLYIVKIITELFGNTESMLRIWSFMMYVFTIALTFYTLKFVLKGKLSLAGAAFVANMKIMMMYSNEFKPYMSDCFAVLFTIVLYYLYNENRINKYVFAFVLCVMVWFSNPFCFITGGILLSELAIGIYRKDYSRIKSSIILGAMILVSFVIYYFYWLKPTIDIGYMTEYWKDRVFPLIPTSASEVSTMIKLTKEFIMQLGIYQLIIFLITLVGIPINLFWVKNKYILVIHLGIFITLFASMLGKYPMIDRLMLFVYPLMVICFFHLISQLYSNRKEVNIITTCISMIMVLISTNGILIYKEK